VLCRYGADAAVTEAKGRRPLDVAELTLPSGDDARPQPGYGRGAMAEWLRPGGGCETLAARARARAAPVSEDDGRVVFGELLCARGVKDACAAAGR
jgi:hypothetical protein